MEQEVEKEQQLRNVAQVKKRKALGELAKLQDELGYFTISRIDLCDCQSCNYAIAFVILLSCITIFLHSAKKIFYVSTS